MNIQTLREELSNKFAALHPTEADHTDGIIIEIDIARQVIYVELEGHRTWRADMPMTDFLRLSFVNLDDRYMSLTVCLSGEVL